MTFMPEASQLDGFHVSKSKNLYFPVLPQILTHKRDFSFEVLLLSICCQLTELDLCDARRAWARGQNYARDPSISKLTSTSYSCTPCYLPSLCLTHSHRCLFLQMWMSAWLVPTVASPASAVWTQWVHMCASCRSLVLLVTSCGTVFARVSSLILMCFIKPIYPAVISRASEIAGGNYVFFNIICRIFFYFQDDLVL